MDYISRKVELSFSALVLFVAIFLIPVAPSNSEPVLDRALSDVRILQQNGCTRLRIGFNFRVRYQSHFPLKEGKELRIVVRPIDRIPPSLKSSVKREAARPSSIATIDAIDFELNRAEGPTLFIYFNDATQFKVSQGPDFTSIVLAISKNKKIKNCEAIFPSGNTDQQVPSKFKKSAELIKNKRVRSKKQAPADNKKMAKMMAEAQALLTKKELRRAIQLLTKILSYPEHTHSRKAKELLGLARERKGQLAHARAEYEEYLAQYPKGDGTERVKQRLAGIMTSHVKPKEKLRKANRGSSDQSKTSSWSVSGSWSQFYYRDQSYRKLKDPSLPPEIQNDPDQYDVHQNELLTSFDLLAKWDNSKFASKLRFSGTQETSFIEGNDDEFSISSLFFEGTVKEWDIVGKVGRQTRNTGGVLGRFDGGLLTWQVAENFKLNGVVGSPVYSRKDEPFNDDKLFYGVSLDYGLKDSPLDTTFYFFEQRDGDLIDRQAIGVEARFFDKNISAFATLDYDIHFSELNTALFSGSWTLEDKSTISLSGEYRKSPTLFASNALQSQPVDNLKQLLGIYSEDEIYRYALDRTATLKSATLGYSRPLNERFQINVDANWSNISGTVESAGVEAQESTGDEFFYSAQLIGSNILKEGDIFVAGLRYADRNLADYYVLDFNTRYPVNDKLRINPRLRFNYKENKFDDLTEFAVLPSIRLNYAWSRDWDFELEFGGKWSQTKQSTLTDEELEYFFILGYRFDFYADEQKKTRGRSSWFK